MAVLRNTAVLILTLIEDLENKYLDVVFTYKITSSF